MTLRQFFFLILWGWLMLLFSLVALLFVPMCAMHAWMENKYRPWRWAWREVLFSGCWNDFVANWRKYG